MSSNHSKLLPLFYRRGISLGENGGGKNAKQIAERGHLADGRRVSKDPTYGRGKKRNPVGKKTR